MLSSGYLAVLGSGALDLPSLLLAGLAIVLRGLAVSGVVKLQLSEPAVTAIAIAYIGFFPLDYYYVSREFLPATIHLVFFLASVIILRAKTPRDYFFVKLSSFLLIVAACVLSSGLGFLAFLGMFLVLAIVTQMSGEIRTNLESPQAIARAGMRGVSRRLVGCHWRCSRGSCVWAADSFSSFRARRARRCSNSRRNVSTCWDFRTRCDWARSAR